ncbi:BZ3501_MvSof-1269-A2-R1_Chr2-2g04419 [Microbotryum saponariae]|nr:BZ3501_MvSof-1269-A2-R1_Chr2-2g04419 [Microbotryum saponariae]
MDARPRLPPELIEAILPHLVPLPSTPLWMLQLEDLTTLRACCLVSSQWRAYAQPQLWSRVILSTTEKLIQFVQVLRASDLEYLQRAVKELWVIAEHERGVSKLFGDYIALRMFPGLRALRVEGLHIPHDFLSFGGGETIKFCHWSCLCGLTGVKYHLAVPPLVSLSVSRLAVYRPEDMRLLCGTRDPVRTSGCSRPVAPRVSSLPRARSLSAYLLSPTIFTIFIGSRTYALLSGLSVSFSYSVSFLGLGSFLVSRLSAVPVALSYLVSLVFGLGSIVSPYLYILSLIDRFAIPYLNPTLDNGLADACSPVPLRHLELRNMFGCSARGSLDKIIRGRTHLESLSIVEALDMQRLEYLWCMQTLTSTPQRSGSSSHTEVSSRQSGLKKLSLTFSPGWGASGRPYDVNLSQQMSERILLPQCPPNLTDLTLSLFTAVPWVQLLIHVLPPSITFLTLLLDREAENPNRTEQGYRDTGLQVSRMVLHELKEDKMPNLRRMLWRDRSGACLGFLVGARLREELAQRGIELMRDA